jgi:hypothetical protein
VEEQWPIPINAYSFGLLLKSSNCRLRKHPFTSRGCNNRWIFAKSGPSILVACKFWRLDLLQNPSVYRMCQNVKMSKCQNERQCDSGIKSSIEREWSFRILLNFVKFGFCSWFLRLKLLTNEDGSPNCLQFVSLCSFLPESSCPSFSVQRSRSPLTLVRYNLSCQNLLFLPERVKEPIFRSQAELGGLMATFRVLLTLDGN